MTAETGEQRTRRERRRALFDSVAGLYESTRLSYAEEIVDRMVTTAGVGAGDAVLEVGCGTGQLTVQLAERGLAVTGLDIGPAMVELARRRVGRARFVVTSFESFDPGDHSYALVVSASAFHWVDPDVGWRKSAGLLAGGGWLALLDTHESYDEPLGSALRELWVRHNDDGRAWLTRRAPTWAEAIAATGLFAAPVVHTGDHRLTLPAETVAGLEQTRATALAYDESSRASFTREFARLLRSAEAGGPAGEIGLEQRTTLTMAQRLPAEERPWDRGSMTRRGH